MNQKAILAPNAPMAPLELASRADRARGEMAGRCDSLVVTKSANLRWLTGFSASNMAAVLTPTSFVVATDTRYNEALEQQLGTAHIEAHVVVGRDVIELALDAALSAGSGSSIGLEAHDITWAGQRAAAEQIGGRASLVATDGLIERVRSIKDSGELDRLKRAAAIADHALGVVTAELSSEVSERQIARRLEAVMVEAGADEPSFPTIVASGPNSARPHAVPSDRLLRWGDLLVIDMGARVDGYGSDMTRSFAVGSFTAATETMYLAVAEAQRAGVDTVSAGVPAKEVDAACRDVLKDHNMADEFIHGTGHGIGLEIHENPFLSASNDSDVLVEAQVVTVEPGVYRPGVGGIRIEDSVIVTADGCQPITLSPKEPLIER